MDYHGLTSEKNKLRNGKDGKEKTFLPYIKTVYTKKKQKKQSKLYLRQYQPTAQHITFSDLESNITQDSSFYPKI